MKTSSAAACVLHHDMVMFMFYHRAETKLDSTGNRVKRKLFKKQITIINVEI